MDRAGQEEHNRGVLQAVRAQHVGGLCLLVCQHDTALMENQRA